MTRANRIGRDFLNLSSFWALGAALACTASAATYTVNSTADDGSSGTLRWAIDQANTNPGDDTIDFSVTGTITLTSALPSIDSNVVIDGPGATNLTISGASTYRIFFINSGTVTIQDLKLTNGRATGGNGGHSRYGGGGGAAAGLGAALFVNAGTIRVSNVTFEDNAATGGNGGNGHDMFPCGEGGGGGGIGGNGASCDASSTGGSGGPLGGSGGTVGSPGTAGGAGAGGGGAQFGAVGGAGGFGGGGGGGGEGASGSAYGGAGGYGGGGGGAGDYTTQPANGGTFGGNGGSPEPYGGGGGGGAGLGGAIFARAGSMLVLNTTFNRNSTTGGTGGTAALELFYGTDGQGKGGAIFVHDDATFQYGNLTFGTGGDANTASDAGSSGTDNANSYGTLAEAIPSVTSITRVGPTPTNVDSVQFLVTFNLAVTGVDLTDFQITPTVITAAELSQISGSGTTYTVTVTTGTGNGTIRLDFVDDDTVVSTESGLPAGGAGSENGDFTSGEVYTIDKAAPGATLSSSSPDPTNAAVNVTVDLGESSTNLVAGDITAVNAAVSDFTGSGDAYSFVLTPSTDGTFSARIADAAFSDAAGNGNSASNTLEFTYDSAGPTVTLATTASNPVHGPITVTATLNEASTNFTADDVTASNASVSNFSGTGDSFSFTLTPTAAGAFSARVFAGTLYDALGNTNQDSNTLERTYDNVAPAVQSVTPATLGPTNAASVEFTVVFDGDVTGFDSDADVTLTHSGTSHSGVVIQGWSPTEYTVTVTGVTGEGSFTLSVDAGAAADAAGNGNAAFGPSSAVQITHMTDIQVAAAVSSAQIDAGAQVTWTITATNSGPLDATNAIVMSQLPSGFTFVSGDSSQGSVAHATGSVAASLGTLSSGGSATVTIVLASTAEASGAATLEAVIESDLTDSNSDNNVAQSAITVNAPPVDNGNTNENTNDNTGGNDNQNDNLDNTNTNTNTNENANSNDNSAPSVAPVLVVTITAEQETISVGDDAAFQVRVENTGDGAAADIHVTIPVPDGLEFVSALLMGDGSVEKASARDTTVLSSSVENGVLTIALGDLPAGQNAQIKLTFRALSSGSIELNATAADALGEVSASGDLSAPTEVVGDDDCIYIYGECVKCGQCGALGITPLLLLLNLVGLKYGFARFRRRR